MDGRPATRWQCLSRAVRTRLPAALLLAAAVAVQAREPTAFRAASALEAAAALLLPVYVAVGLAWPSRSPQDRWAGTCVVPR